MNTDLVLMEVGCYNSSGRGLFVVNINMPHLLAKLSVKVTRNYYIYYYNHYNQDHTRSCRHTLLVFDDCL